MSLTMNTRCSLAYLFTLTLFLGCNDSASIAAGTGEYLGSCGAGDSCSEDLSCSHGICTHDCNTTCEDGDVCEDTCGPAGVCAAGVCLTPALASVSLGLDISFELPAAGTEVRTENQSFVAQGAAVFVIDREPSDADVSLFEAVVGWEKIDLANWNPRVNLITVPPNENLSEQLYALVRLCDDVQTCSWDQLDTQRTFVWKVEHPFYRAVRTELTLPIPSGPAADPDNTTGLDGVAAELGCVLDDWSHLLPTWTSAQPIEINRCFVYARDCMDGIRWGCDSNLVNGTSGNLVCDLEQTSSRHYCE